MAAEKKSSGDVLAVLVSVVLGIAIGTAIKRIKLGILIGLVTGCMIVLSSWIRLWRK